jgi:SAM-dependent methyltransferase
MEPFATPADRQPRPLRLDSRERVRRSYDALADEYARRVGDELDHKPLDRELLEQLAADAKRLGPVCDLGCGPGHVAAYLRDCGADVCGIDLSPRLVAVARRRYPAIPFSVGDARDLDVDAETFGAVVAFYSLIHLERTDFVAALREVRRVLRPRGVLLAAFHRGSDRVHLDDWWGTSVDLDFQFYEPDQVCAAIADAGFRLERLIERPPYEGVEFPSHRFYVRAGVHEASRCG